MMLIVWLEDIVIKTLERQESSSSRFRSRQWERRRRPGVTLGCERSCSLRKGRCRPGVYSSPPLLCSVAFYRGSQGFGLRSS